MPTGGAFPQNVDDRRDGPWCRLGDRSQKRTARDQQFLDRRRFFLRQWMNLPSHSSESREFGAGRRYSIWKPSIGANRTHTEWLFRQCRDRRYSSASCPRSSPVEPTSNRLALLPQVAAAVTAAANFPEDVRFNLRLASCLLIAFFDCENAGALPSVLFAPLYKNGLKLRVRLEYPRRRCVR
jgi:hypothetical protein